jgi:type I restriction enzyme, R subunit
VKVEPISILDDFQKEVKTRGRPKTKAAEIEHAIRHHLDVDLDDDPDLRASFAEALKKVFEDFRDNWNKIYEELEKLRRRIMDADKEPTYGLHRKKEMPFFRMLKKETFGDAAGDEDDISSLVALTQHLFGNIERELKLTGFWQSIPARNKLRADIQRTLLHGICQAARTGENRAHIISRIMEIAEKNNDTILHAT